MSDKFNEMLLMYKYNFSQAQIEKIGSFWEKFINFSDIRQSNFLSSKYALAIGDVASFLVNKFPFIEKEFLDRIIPEIKTSNTFNVVNNGTTFQYLCYSLFKNYDLLQLANETTGASEPSMDFSLTTNAYELEIKTVQLKSMGDNFTFIEKSISRFLEQANYGGSFYINLTFYNQKLDQDLLNKTVKKTILLLSELIKKIPTTDYSLLAEDFERKIYNFALIRIHYQPINIHFNSYRIGGDLAGNFCDAHGISKGGGGFCLSIDHMEVDIWSKVKDWCDKKLKNKQGGIMFSVSGGYDDESIKNAFIKTNKQNPNLVALFHLDLWDDKKFAKINVYCKKTSDVVNIVNEFDSGKVDLNITETAE